MTIGPAVIELYLKKRKIIIQSLLLLFFRKRHWIHLYMITGVIRWMKTKISLNPYLKGIGLKMTYSLRRST